MTYVASPSFYDMHKIFSKILFLSRNWWGDFIHESHPTLGEHKCQ